MDFLGLRTLGVLSRACRNIEARFGTKVIPEEIPIDDERAFVLMQSATWTACSRWRRAVRGLVRAAPTEALLGHRRLDRAQTVRARWNPAWWTTT